MRITSQCQTRFPVKGGVDRIAFIRQAAAQYTHNGFIIFDDQDSFFHGPSSELLYHKDFMIATRKSIGSVTDLPGLMGVSLIALLNCTEYAEKKNEIQAVTFQIWKTAC